MALFDAVRVALTRASKPTLVAQALRLELLRLRFDRSQRWESQRLLMEAALQLYLRAYQQRDPVVFTSLFTPPELIHALGLVPFGLDTSGAAAPALGLTDQVLGAADRAWAPIDSCSILRASLGAAHMGLLPQPVAAVCTSSLCDSTTKVFEAVADLMGGVPFRVLDVPQTRSAEGVEYLAWQLEDMVHELERLTGRQLQQARLTEAIDLSNRARDHLLALDRLRVAHPGVLDTEHAIGFLYPLGLLLGSRDGVSVFGSFRAEVAAAIPRHSDDGGPHILWMHLLPHYSNDLLETVEGAGATVVYEEIIRPYWDELDPTHPFESLARKCIDHPWNGPLERRIESVLGLVRDYRIDGAIHFSHHGCRQSYAALRAVRDALVEKGIPLLELEGDLVDARDRADGQHRTRLEAFVETLGTHDGRAAPKRYLGSETQG